MVKDWWIWVDCEVGKWPAGFSKAPSSSAAAGLGSEGLSGGGRSKVGY